MKKEEEMMNKIENKLLNFSSKAFKTLLVI
jgi:hypothetical protein